MLAQTKRRESKLIHDEPDRPVYGGMKDINDFKRNLSDLDVTQTFEKYVRDRAVHHLKSDGDSNSRALIELADLHFKNQRFGKALDYYKRSLNSEPDNVVVLQKLVQSLIATQKLSEADQYFKKLLTVVDEHPRYLSDYLNFRIMLSINDASTIDDTAVLFERYKKSKSDTVLNIIGIFEGFVLENTKLAKAYFQKSLSINPNNIDANNNIGLCYRLENNFKLADKYFNKAHYLDLKYLTAYENLAGSYYLQKDLKKAISILENAKENNVKLSLEWRDNLALFYFHLHRYTQSLDEYKDLDKEHPNNNLIINNIGAVHERLGNQGIAKQHFVDAIAIVRKRVKLNESLDSRSAIAFNNLTRILIREGDYSEATKILKSAQKLFPQDYESYHQDAIIHIRQRKYEEAERLLQKSISLNPMAYDSILDLSYIYLDIEFEFEKAIELLKSVEISEDLAQIKMLVDNNLAYAYLKTGKINEAEKLLHSNDKSFASYTTKGYFYLLKDDLTNAKAMYDKALKVAEGNDLRRVKQFYHYEMMEYWSIHNNIAKALSHAEKSKSFALNESIEKIVDTFIALNSR